MDFATEEVEDPKIDITPMIDCVFQLLLFFMLAAKFKTLDAKIETHLPSGAGISPAPAPDVTPTCIRISTSGWTRTAEGRGLPRVIHVKVGAIEIGAYANPTLEVADGTQARVGRGVVLERLREVLCQTMRAQGDAANDEKYPVILVPDAAVPCDDVVQVVDQMLAAKVPNISFGGSISDLEECYKREGLPVPERWD